MIVTKKRLSDIVRQETDKLLRELARKRAVGRPKETDGHKRKVRDDYERRVSDRKAKERGTKSLKNTLDTINKPWQQVARGILETDDDQRGLLLDEFDPSLASDEELDKARMMQVANLSPLDRCDRILGELEDLVIDEDQGDPVAAEPVTVSLDDEERHDALYDKAKGVQQCQLKLKQLKQDLLSKMKAKCPFSFDDYVRITRIAQAAEKLKKPFSND